MEWNLEDLKKSAQETIRTEKLNPTIRRRHLPELPPAISDALSTLSLIVEQPVQKISIPPLVRQSSKVSRDLDNQLINYRRILQAIRTSPAIFGYSSLARELGLAWSTTKRYVDYLYATGKISGREFNFGNLSTFENSQDRMTNEDFSPVLHSLLKKGGDSI